MKSLLIIASFLISLDGYAQKESKFLFDKASSFYYGVDLQDSTNINFKKDFDSSLAYFKILNKKFPNYRRLETLDRLSVCYFERKEFSKSLSFALEVLSNFKTSSIEDSNYCFECNSACYRIGYIYQLEKKFETALSYYDSCSTKYTTPPAFCSISYYVSKVPEDYNLFLCYKGLGQNKKAIQKLTPYMFDSTLNDYLDSAVVSDYVSLILSLQTKAQIKQNIESSIDSLHYNAEIAKSQDGSKYNFTVECWLNLFDTKIFLINGVSWSDDSDKIDNWLSKESQIQKIKKSVGFKKIFVP